MGGGLIGLSPWGWREPRRWGWRLQTHEKLEVLFETEAGAVVMISETLRRLCTLLKCACGYFQSFVKERIEEP